MIKWVEDLGAPALVTVADIATSEKKPTWNRPLGIGLSALGYIVGGMLGIGGAFTKNLGIAAAPWAFQSIYLYIKESQSSVTASQMAALQMAAKLASRVGAPISPKVTRSYQPEMSKAVAF